MLIELGILSYKHLLFILLPISVKIQGLLIDHISERCTKLYLIFNEYLSMSISGIIIHLLIKYFSKTKKQKENEQNHKEKEKELKDLTDTVKSGNKPMNQYQIIASEIIHKKRIEKRKQFLFLILITYIQFFGFIMEHFLIGKFILMIVVINYFLERWMVFYVVFKHLF